MKKTITTFFFATVGVISLNLILGDTDAHSEAGGAPNNGACTACHGGTVQASTDMKLMVLDPTSQVEVTEYTPGNEYLVYVGMKKTGTSKFGFSLNANAGTFAKVSTSDTRTKIATFGYATHTSSGTAATGDTVAWMVKWTAPSAPSGNLNFQLYVNATNSDNTSAGDAIYGKQLVLNQTVGLEKIDGLTQLHVFPQPANGQINLAFHLNQNRDITCNIYDLNGRLISTPYALKNISGEQKLVIGTETMQSGIYFVQLVSGDQILTKKVLVQ